MTIKYNQRELFGMLTNIGSITNISWNMVMKIVEYMPQIKVLEKQWRDWDYKNQSPEHYPLDLSNIKTWSTYDEKCIDLDFFVNDDKKLICDVVIWNGDSFDGHRTNRRFSAKLQFPNKFIKELNKDIHWKFNRFLNNQYKIHLENQRQAWINSTRKEFMDFFNKKEKVTQ